MGMSIGIKPGITPNEFSFCGKNSSCWELLRGRKMGTLCLKQKFDTFAKLNI
jgi:hypothetical protein